MSFIAKVISSLHFYIFLYLFRISITYKHCWPMVLFKLYGTSCLANHTLKIRIYTDFRWQEVIINKKIDHETCPNVKTHIKLYTNKDGILILRRMVSIFYFYYAGCATTLFTYSHWREWFQQLPLRCIFWLKLKKKTTYAKPIAVDIE